MLKNRHTRNALVAGIAALALIAPVALASPGKGGSAPDRIEGITLADGREMVIVTLDTAMPDPVAGDLGIKRTRETAIRATQLDVLRSLSPEMAASLSSGADHPQVVQAYDQLPMMTLALTRAEIAKLRTDARVIGIEPVVADPVNLSVSTTRIGANTLWAAGLQGTGQKVAIFDTGSDVDHSFLSSSVVGQACFSRTTGAGTGTDDSITFCPNGLSVDTTSAKAGDDCTDARTPGATPVAYGGCNHGSHVAGISLGRGAGQTFTGVARNSGLIAVQVFSGFPNRAGGPTALSFSSDQLAAMNHILGLVNGGDTSIASINMSLGGGQVSAYCNTDSRATAVNSLRTAGVLTAIASGNDGFTDAVSSPSCIQGAITVGSSDSRSTTESISIFSNSSPLVDVVAPGSGINSSIPTNTFASFNGTSMATPHVAGAIAVLRSRTPRPTPDEIEQALRYSTGLFIRDTDAGWTFPRIDLPKANDYLAGSVRVTPLAAMNFRPTGPTGTAQQVYTLRNNGTSAQAFTAATTAGWLTVSPTSGSIPAGGTVDITVTANAAHSSAVQGAQSARATVTYGSRTVDMIQHMLLPQPPPANDNFANGTVLATASGSANGTTAVATGETGEPATGAAGSTLNSVWFRYTAGAAGNVTFTTVGSDFDTVLSVYTGTAVNALTLVTENDDTVGLTSSVTFAATSGTTYHIRVDGFGSAVGNYTFNWSGLSPGGGMLTAPVAAILPQARAVAVNTTANAFATIVNPHAQQLTNCRVEMPASGAPAGTFSYQTTNSANALTGTANTPVNIAASGSQGFVFGFRPSATFAANTMAMRFRCDNAADVVSITGVNTFTLTSSTAATPDIVALAASGTPGAVVIPTTGSPPTGVFAVATVNVGAAGTIFVTADTGTATLPVNLFLCQTNPTTGACTSAIGTSVSASVAANATPTFAAFVQGTGTVANNAATNRVFVRFRTGSVTGPIVGATSVAVRTAP